MEIERACHCTYRIRYHMVFVVKYRKQMLLDKVPLEYFKRITARMIFEDYPDVKEFLWGGEFWSDGGHIDTVSEYGGLEKIKRYVEEQGKNKEQLQLVDFNS